jgi:hypothetical protein
MIRYRDERKERKRNTMTTNETKAIRDAFADKLSYSYRDWKPARYDEMITIDYSRIMVLADAHIPRHSPELLAAALGTALDNDVECIVWLGDVLDMSEFSTWGVDDASSMFMRNCKYAGEVLREFADRGFYQVWSMGNHENRVGRATKGQIDLDATARMCGLSDLIDSGDLLISEHPTVLFSEGNWMATHPATFGAPGVTPGKLAQRFQKNVISAHEHAFCMGRDETDTFWTVNAGGLFQKELHKYVMHNVTNHRSWVNGYVIIDAGVPRMFHSSEVL